MDWQMCQAPQAEGRNHSVAVIEGGEILGVMGVTPAIFSDPAAGGRGLPGAELTTWVVAPQARYRVLMGAGISAAALPLYLQAGFSFLVHVPRFFHIADFTKITRFVDSPPTALLVTARRQAAAVPSQWPRAFAPASVRSCIP